MIAGEGGQYGTHTHTARRANGGAEAAELAPRGDSALEPRNVTPAGFDARAREDLPWFNWRRQPQP